jgi:hypothetical protein
MMADYRLYRFDGGSRIELAEWIKASDDDDAIRQIRELGNKAAMCELWQGKRLIIALGQQDLAQ